jgi:sec-independent protein translocase protein TatA
MGFGSLGISELLVIFVVVLVFFGPKRLPEVARSMGSAMREFRRSLNQIQRELEEADPTSALRKETRSILSQLPEQVRPAMAGDGSPQRTTEAEGAAVREAAPPPPAPEATSEPEPRVKQESSPEAGQSSEPTDEITPREPGSESG